MSRNYQEMRERLRLLLTKKKAKCKIGGTGTGGTSGTGSATVAQVGTAPSSGTTESAVKASAGPAGGASSVPSPTASGPVLAKQDSADSLPQAVKDPRDLEALLDFIEGNQSSKCKDAKKAAKKARQKQKKVIAFIVMRLFIEWCVSFKMQPNNSCILQYKNEIRIWSTVPL